MAPVNVNWEFLFGTTTPGITVQPSRWEAFRQKLQHLSRRAILSWVEDMFVTPFADVIYLSVPELQAMYEGRAITTTAPEMLLAMDLVVSDILGGPPSGGLVPYGSSRAVEAVAACNWALDDPTVPLP